MKGKDDEIRKLMAEINKNMEDYQNLLHVKVLDYIHICVLSYSYSKFPSVYLNIRMFKIKAYSLGAYLFFFYQYFTYLDGP